MRVIETTIGFWECPDCFCKNSIFLTEGELLPEELDCDFCCHKSGEIEWIK